MYIKVEIESQDSVVYVLKGTEILIGSNLSSDLFINESSVSKRHLKIIFEQDHWTAVDQGSTNGTFLGGEKLVPGKKIDIFLNDQLLLGSLVALTFLESADDYVELEASKTALPGIVTNHDKTQVISMEDFKHSKLKAEQEKRKLLLQKKAAEARRKKEEANRHFYILIIGLIIVVLGFFGNKAWNLKNKKVKRDTIVNKMKTKMKGDDEIDTDIMGYRINRSVLIKRNRINTMMELPKCLSPETLDFCKTPSPFLGVLHEDKSLIFFADEKEWKLKSAILLGNEGVNPSTLNKISFLMVLDREIINLGIPDGRGIYVAFYNEDDNQRKILSFVGALESGVLKHVVDEFKDEEISGSAEEASKVSEALDPYFTIY